MCCSPIRRTSSASGCHLAAQSTRKVIANGASERNLKETPKLSQRFKDSLDVVINTNKGFSASDDGPFLGVKMVITVQQLDIDPFETSVCIASFHCLDQLSDLQSQSMGQSFATNVEFDHASIRIDVINGDDKIFHLREILRVNQVQELIAATWGQSAWQQPAEAERDGIVCDEKHKGVGAVELITAFEEELFIHAKK